MEDAAMTAAFVLLASRRRRWKEMLAQSDSPQDVLLVATSAFASNQNWPEILRFINRVRDEEPRIVCEIGVAGGGTNLLLAHALRRVELVIGIDLFVKGRQRLRYFARPDQRLLYFNGPSQGERMVARVGTALAGRKLDLLFIDGDHSYSGARDDFLAYKPFVREGGTIAFHDICPDYMTRFGRPTGNFAGEVPVLWKKIRELYPHEEFVENVSQDGFGIGAIRYSSVVPMPADL
jgi:predicted O-methyltransferase YrrM